MENRKPKRKRQKISYLMELIGWCTCGVGAVGIAGCTAKVILEYLFVG